MSEKKIHTEILKILERMDEMLDRKVLTGDNVHSFVDQIRELITVNNSSHKNSFSASDSDVISLTASKLQEIKNVFHQLEINLETLNFASDLVDGFKPFIETILLNFDSMKSALNTKTIIKTDYQQQLMLIFSNIEKIGILDKKGFTSDEISDSKTQIKLIFKEIFGSEMPTGDAIPSPAPSGDMSEKPPPVGHTGKPPSKKIQINSQKILNMQKSISSIQRYFQGLRVLDRMKDFEKIIGVIDNLTDKLKKLTVDSEVGEDEITMEFQTAYDEINHMSEIADMLIELNKSEKDNISSIRVYSTKEINNLYIALKGCDLPQKVLDSDAILEIQAFMRKILACLEMRDIDMRTKQNTIMNDFFSEFETYFNRHISRKNTQEIREIYTKSFESLLSSKTTAEQGRFMSLFKPILSAMIDKKIYNSFDTNDTSQEYSKKIKLFILGIQRLSTSYRGAGERLPEIYNRIREKISQEYNNLKREITSSGFMLEVFETKFKFLLSTNTSWNFCRYLMRDTMKFEAIEA